MKVTRNGNQVQVILEGAVGESMPLFSMPLAQVTELIMDMSLVTYINSIGVKHWILWTNKIPRTCQVKLINCPFVIASQASQVIGFMKNNMSVESIRAPFVCESCGHEEMHLATRGVEYEYPTAQAPHKVQLNDKMTCSKCKTGRLEPDFLIEKTFKFLEMGEIRSAS